MNYNGNVSTEDILKDLISTDQTSIKKTEMVKGVNYYNTKNDIINRDFREYYIDGVKYIDYNKSNEMIVNNMQKTLVDQKVGYIASKPVLVTSDTEGLADRVNEVLGSKFNELVQDLIKNTSNKGEEGLQSFIDSEGKFDYTLIPGEQLITIKDTTFQDKIVQVVRYYVMEEITPEGTKEVIRAELWDDEKVTRYQEVEQFGEKRYVMIAPGTCGVTHNPEYHWYTYNTCFTDASQMESFGDVMPNGVEAHSWGEIPIVINRNNSESRNDLMPIKMYIDALDIVSSGFINDLKDIQLAVWVLRGYEGTELSEFMLNLQKFKAIKLSTDSNASAEPKTMDIPKEARKVMLDWLEKKIYEVGQGVDVTKISGGSITNVVIAAMYEGLRLKSDQLIVKLTKTLSDFMYFVVKYINDEDDKSYDYKDVKFVFNTSMLFNNKELVETLVMLKGIISDKTLLVNIPFVDNVEEELKQIALEQKSLKDEELNRAKELMFGGE